MQWEPAVEEEFKADLKELERLMNRNDRRTSYAADRDSRLYQRNA